MYRSKESIIAILLVVFCAFASVLLFIQKPNVAKVNADEETGAVSTFASSFMKDKVLVLGMEGPIFDQIHVQSPFKTSFNASYIKDQLQKALKDSNIKAILLRMNSPGGTVAASQEIYELVLRIRKEKEIPVYVSMGDVCASGCYYIASAADKIVANKGTLTGSIGVISQGMNFVGLMQKLGIQSQTFKAGKYKDVGSSQRYMTAEEKKIMQALLDDSYEQFLSDIAVGRSMDRVKLNKIAEGLIYTGSQALEVNLVDFIGTYADAKDFVRKALEEAEYENAETIRFEETWKQGQLKSINDLLPFSISSILSKCGIDASILSAADTRVPSVSKFQPLWMME